MAYFDFSGNTIENHLKLKKWDELKKFFLI